jgi:hypothetical protein
MQDIPPRNSERKPAQRSVPRVSAKVTTTTQRRALYDGQTLLGSIAQNGQEFRAYGRRGQPLGVFDTAIEAANAIAKAAS